MKEGAKGIKISTKNSIASLEQTIQDKRRLFVYSFVAVTLIVLLAPLFTRWMLGNDTLPGEESYAHLMLAESLVQEERAIHPIYEGREFFITPYHRLLAFTGRIFGLETGSLILGLLLGLLSSLLFFLLLKHLDISLTERLLIMLPLVLSPVFIYLFTAPNPHSFAVLLLLLGAYLATKTYAHKGSEEWLTIAGKLTAVICLFLVSMFSLFHAGLAIVLALWYGLQKGRGSKKRGWMSEWVYVLLAVALSILAVLIFKPAGYYVYYQIEHSLATLIPLSISDLGAYLGFGPFSLVLAGIGLYESWKNKKQHLIRYLLTITLFTLVFWYGNTIFFYLLWPAVYYMGLGLTALRSLHWRFTLLKNLTLLVVICGLLFSTISFMNQTAQGGATQDMKEGLEMLQGLARTDDVVLTSHTNGFVVEYLAKRKVLLDGAFYTIPNLEEAFEASYRLFYPPNQQALTSLLEQHHIQFMVIDKKMKEDLWNNKKQGLLAHLDNEKLFKRILTSPDLEIWQVQRG